MKNHSLGPWTVRRQNQSPTSGEWMIAGSNPGYLAEVRDCGSGIVEANANLIASAPELYDALKELAQWYQDYTGLPACSANAALAKARGEA